MGDSTSASGSAAVKARISQQIVQAESRATCPDCVSDATRSMTPSAAFHNRSIIGVITLEMEVTVSDAAAYSST